MKEIKRGVKLTLSDNKEYLVLSKVTYESKDYVYMISFEKDPSIKICCLNKLDNKLNLVPVKNDEIVSILLNLFVKDLETIF